MRQRSTRGFTLIELLVVISIIGLISTIGGVAWKNARQKSRDGVRKANLDQVKKALELYADSNGSQYPVQASFACLSSTVPAGLTPYIDPVPQDPILTRTSVVTGCVNYQSDGSNYKLRTNLELDTDSMSSDGGSSSSWYELFTGGAQSW